MGSQELGPVDRAVSLVRERRDFLLQGGAGSGKTESLKQVVQTLTHGDPSLTIACITHTNKAADEIQDRVNADITVATIHSFLSSLIKPYGRDIQRVFPELFLVERFEPYTLEYYAEDDKERKKQEHERFKKWHKTVSDRRRIVLQASTDKVTGKREYDKDPDHYNSALNGLIEEVNSAIRDYVASRSPKEFHYNETIFDNFKECSFGHDGLLAVTSRIFDQSPLLGKILGDRFDCIFIDEYQDTNAEIIWALLATLHQKRAVIGLFGDSEQAIYSDGIGNARSYVDDGKLVLVEKEDNFRCSPQVIEVANQFRSDGLSQKVALKTRDDGTLETKEDREGSVVFYYAIMPVTEGSESNDSEENNNPPTFESARDALIEQVAHNHPNFIQLKLTNKSIAQNVGFGRLYQIFDGRYLDPRDRIKSTLDRLQLGELFELVQLFGAIEGDRRAYNRLIARLRKRHFVIRSVEDKRKLHEILRSLNVEDRGAYEAVDFAAEEGLIRRSDSHNAFLARRRELLERLSNDPVFKEFEQLHCEGANTLLRMKKALASASTTHLNEALLDERYDDMSRDLKESQFQENLFSPDLKFSEIAAYYRYEDDDATFATMHKTKGTGIPQVMVVLDEYGWNQYDFLSCFSGKPPETSREESTRKLLYVACSRAEKDLICVRLVRDEHEAQKISAFFPEAKRVDLALTGNSPD